MTTQSAEAGGALPALPSVAYVLELGVVHLGHDHLLSGSSGTLAMLTEGLPENLRSPYASRRQGLHLGEIGRTAVVLENEEVPGPQRQVRAVHKSAAALSMLGVVDAVAGEYRSDRTVHNTGVFLSNVSRALTGEDLRSLRDGPRQQYAAYDYASRVSQWLDLSDRGRYGMGRAFDEWANIWLEHLSESGRHDPRAGYLLETAQHLGAHRARVAAWATLESSGQPVLQHAGEISGVESQGANFFRAVGRRVHTYATTLVQDHGARRGLREARAMRDAANSESYAEALKFVSSDRHRKVIRTAAWVAARVASRERRREGVEGGHADLLAGPLQIAVRVADWRVKTK